MPLPVPFCVCAFTHVQSGCAQHFPGCSYSGLGGVAEEQAGRRTERDNTVLACSLAHSHIKSNSFIFYIYTSQQGWGGVGWARGGLLEGLLWPGAGGSLGKSDGVGPYAKGSPISSSGPRPRSSRFSSVLPGSGGCRDRPCTVWHTRGW